MTDAITREEKLLAGIAIEPITREEMFLAKLAGQNVNTPEPITRKEKLMQRIIDNGISGGGDESVWVEDDSKIVIENLCYQNPTVGAFITENGTLTYKKIKTGYPSHEPKCGFENFNQMGTYGFGANNKYWYNVEQAEVINDEQYASEPITTIGDNSFACLTRLKRVRLPEGITKIGDTAFAICESLKKVDLPNTITSIGKSAFQRSGLEVFDIPQNVTQLEYSVFSNCHRLKKINGIERMVSIGISCFDECISLTGELVFNEALDVLGNYCFRCCQIDTVKFKGTPTSVSSNVFSGCTNLLDIYVPWAEGEVANAPWGATNATIHYNTVYDENHEPIV